MEAAHGTLLRRAALACFGLLGAFASPAAAATVTSDVDSLPPEPGELRYEISNAAPGETVTIAPGISPGLDWGVLLIDKNLILEGQGPHQTSIRQEDDDRRIILVGSVDPTAMVTIRNLSLQNADAQDGTTGNAGQSGGAIENQGVLTLDQLWFYENSAGDGGNGAAGANGNPGDPGDPGRPGGSGGAVHNTVGGDLFITNSTFQNNHAGNGGRGGNGGNTTVMFGGAGAGGVGGAGQDGGAISNAGDMTVTNSTFFGNTTGVGGIGGDGGNGFGGTGGTGGAGGEGGAIHQAGAGSLTITNSTIASNAAGAGGAGGMGILGQAANGAAGSGGGTYFFVGVTVANTLYSQNTATTGSNCGGGGTITADGANLSFPSGGCPASFSTGDPQLGPLMSNGGPTQTMALSPGSAAINQVPVGEPNCPGADQRGIARPQGPACDIGAFELEMAPVAPTTPPASTANPTTPAATPAAATPATKKCKKKRGRPAIARKKKCKRKKR